MKKLILLLSILIVLTHARAQVTHHYLNSVTERIDTNGHVISQSYGDTAGGQIYVSKRLIKIDWKLTRRKVYTIISTGDLETVDENYKLQELTVMEMAGKRSVHLLVAFYLVDPNGKVSDIIFKDPGKVTVVTTYTIIPLLKRQRNSADVSIKSD